TTPGGPLDRDALACVQTKRQAVQQDPALTVFGGEGATLEEGRHELSVSCLGDRLRPRAGKAVLSPSGTDSETVTV
ncbi:MAG: hypothetical protein P8127_12140, partial [Acidobacteriota bacterium]